MADGFADRFVDRGEVTTRAYDENNKQTKSRWQGDKTHPAPKTTDINAYEFKLDKGLDPKDNLVVFNTTIFKSVFDKGQDGTIYKSGEATLTVHYPKKRFGLFEYKDELRVPVAVVRRNAGKKYRDAPLSDPTWASTIGFSQQLMTLLDKPEYLSGKRLRISISTKKPNILLGVIWQHPRYDINMGFIWAEVGFLVSLVFYILDLFGDAYHWSDHVRALLNHTDK